MFDGQPTLVLNLNVSFSFVVSKQYDRMRISKLLYDTGQCTERKNYVDVSHALLRNFLQDYP